MSEQTNSSKRLIGVSLLIIGTCLLVAQYLINFIFPSIVILPRVAQEVAATQSVEEAYVHGFAAMDEEMKTVVAQEVDAARMADAGVTQEDAVVEEMEGAVAVEPSFRIEPVFVVEPDIRTQFNVLGAFRIVVSLVGFIFLGMGIYLLNNRREIVEPTI